MQDLKICTIQFNIAWMDPKSNFSYLEKLLNDHYSESDLILLPEMFTSGFTMVPYNLPESNYIESKVWLANISTKYKSSIAGSVVCKIENAFFNRLILFNNELGECLHYNKRHLFRMAGEHEIYSRGLNKLISIIKGWKIAFFICYDLRFPVWCRNHNLEYDVAVFVANWPEKRINHWKNLLIARAIENQCYVIGVNRTGIDGNGFVYSGQSMVINPLGEILSNADNEEGLFPYILDRKFLEQYRDSFPVWKDSDDFSLDFS